MTSPARKIRASDLLKDVQAGLNDFQIMAKHGINAKQLEYLFHKMTEAGLITKRELELRTSMSETSITKAFVDVQQSIDSLEEKDVTDSESVYRNVLQDLATEVSCPAHAVPRSEPTRKIRASDLVKDITCGMSDPALLAKYRLQPNQLEFMLRKLAEAGRVTETQLVERTRITSTSITKAFVDVYQSLRELDEEDWGDM